ncbi:MAG: TY-Chap domain-containing protein [Candidatus Dormibacteraceae bacterium]
MKREIRLALFEKALSRLLSEHEDHDFVIFELRDRPDSYVQYMLHDGAILGEVDSRGWIAESQQLDKERVTALGCLGFEGGGLKANFARDHLPQNARRLACLTELLFGAAYRPGHDFDVAVMTKSMIETVAAQRRSAEVDA